MEVLDLERICRVLGVTRDADAATVKQAYRALAMRYHPDRNPGDAEARTRFDEVNRAYAEWSAAQQADAPQGTPFDFANFQDLFSDLFGGAGRARGADLRLTLTLTPADAAIGRQRDITVARRTVCPSCKGSGDVSGGGRACAGCGGSGKSTSTSGFLNIATTCAKCRGRGKLPEKPCAACQDGTRETIETLKVTVPPGVSAGQSLRLAGKGSESPLGPPGDLYLLIEIGAASRQGADATVEVMVDARHVLFGGKMLVATVNGPATVKVPGGVRDGDRVTVPGHGHPKAAGGDPYRGATERGDQIVIFRVPPELRGLRWKMVAGLVVAAGTALLIMLSGCARAEAAPPKLVVLKAARLFDGKSDSVVSPGIVVVSGDSISAVGKAPEGAQVIDLGDATLMPGLMDAHTHLTGEMTDDWKQHELDGLKKPIPQLTIEATVHARRTLMAGVTTVRDLGSHDLIDVGLRNAIREGVIPGPRMLVAVDALGAVGGHCDDTEGFRPGVLVEKPIDERSVQTGPDALRGAVRYMAKHGADVIKVCATGGVLSQTDSVDSPQLTQAELDAIVDEAHALGRKTAAHAHGAEGAKRALRAGIDSIEHGTFLDEEGFALVKKKNVPVVFTPCLCLSERFKRAGAPALIVEKEKKAHARQAETFKLALQKGIPIAFGTDSAVCPHGGQAEQLAYMVSLGMKPLAALRSATSVDAKLLGLADKTGTLELGKWADIIAVPGDPAADIRAMSKVFFVMKQGTVYRHDTGAPAIAR